MTILHHIKSLLGLDSDQAAHLKRLPVSGPDRRDFLRALVGAGAVAATCDAEKLLWVSGEKTIIIPPAPQIVSPLIEPLGIEFRCNADTYIQPAVDRMAQNIELQAAIWVQQSGWKVGDVIHVRKPERFSYKVLGVHAEWSPEAGK